MTEMTKMQFAGRSLLLRNTRSGRFHPVILAPMPAPGGQGMGILPHRSLFTHKNGFESRDMADQYVRERDSTHPTGIELTWDGEEMPVFMLDLPAIPLRTEPGLS